MKFTLTIDSDNAALAEGGRDELVRMLHRVIGQVADGHDTRNVLDVNGNSVGAWKIEEEGDNE